jgi:hypothetical protein
MIRFIIQRSQEDRISGAQWKSYETLDVDVPELERQLSLGGFGENGHDIRTLLGSEVIRGPAVSSPQSES